MGDIGAFLAMGGYAGFVWPAYGVALAVLGGLAVHSRGGATARAPSRWSGCSRTCGRRR